MASIRKKSGKWYVQIRRKGHVPLGKSFLKKADAEEWARYMEHQADRRSLPYDPKRLDSITLKEMLERYRDDVVSLKRCTDRETVMIDAFIKRAPEIVSLPLSKVTSAHFSKYRDQRLETLKPASICRELGLIQHAYSIAVTDWDIPIPANPLEKVKKPVINNRRERRFEGDELRRLLKALKKCQNPYMRPFVLFAIQTGMRRGEILAARWKDINFTHRTLFIPISKNGRSRTIPLTGKAIRILRYMEKISAGREVISIFPLTIDAVKLAWVRLVKRAKITGLKLHDMRHVAVSRFFEKGLTVPEVAMISGHLDYRMLARYTHLKAELIAQKLK